MKTHLFDLGEQRASWGDEMNEHVLIQYDKLAEAYHLLSFVKPDMVVTAGGNVEKARMLMGEVLDEYRRRHDGSKGSEGHRGEGRDVPGSDDLEGAASPLETDRPQQRDSVSLGRLSDLPEAQPDGSRSRGPASGPAQGGQEAKLKHRTVYHLIGEDLDAALASQGAQITHINDGSPMGKSCRDRLHGFLYAVSRLWRTEPETDRPLDFPPAERIRMP